MAFKKGQSGNPSGRKKGTPNIMTRDLRERLKTVLEESFENVVADMLKLNPKEKVDAWLKMAEYVLPKLNRSEVEASITDLSNTVQQNIIHIAFRPPNDDLAENEKTSLSLGGGI